MSYLKEEQYYIDRYDLHTIEEYLRWYWDIKDAFEKNRGDKDFQKYTKKKFDTEVRKNYQLHDKYHQNSDMLILSRVNYLL